MEILIREFQSPHMGEILELDEIAAGDPLRVSLIRNAVEHSTCLIAEGAGRILGYGILDYSFFGQGFIPLVYVRADARRSGVGANLIESLESRCATEKLFTSTNESNAPMKALLSKLGFDPSGIIHNLDPEDPEIVYFKRRTTNAA